MQGSSFLQQLTLWVLVSCIKWFIEDMETNGGFDSEDSFQLWIIILLSNPTQTFLPYLFQEGRRTGGFFVGLYVIINFMREEGIKKVSFLAGLLLLIALLLFFFSTKVWFAKILGIFSKPLLPIEKVLLSTYQKGTGWATYFATIRTKDQQIFQL